MSMFSIQVFPASGFDVKLTGMPNFDVILRSFVSDVAQSSLVVPIMKLSKLTRGFRPCLHDEKLDRFQKFATVYTRDRSQNVLRLNGNDPGNFHHIVYKSFLLR